MGESTRRQTLMGEEYGQEQNILPWLPLKKSQAQQFVKVSTQAAWAGIILMVVAWVVIRFIGPNLGWWTLVN